MKGKYEVVVKSRRVQYKFSVIRNITILRGDSATGKTTLIDMIAAYQENGEASGVTVISKSNARCLQAYAGRKISVLYTTALYSLTKAINSLRLRICKSNKKYR